MAFPARYYTDAQRWSPGTRLGNKVPSARIRKAYVGYKDFEFLAFRGVQLGEGFMNRADGRYAVAFGLQQFGHEVTAIAVIFDQEYPPLDARARHFLGLFR